MDKKFVEIEKIINKILLADSLGIDNGSLINECQELLIEYNNGVEIFRKDMLPIVIRECNNATKLKEANSTIKRNINSK